MTHFPDPGQIFADRYRVEVLLGSGGFSRVYLATQLDVDRKVALKLLRPPIDHGTPDQQRARLDTMATRFRREARMLSQLRSPTTITMYDYGQTPDGLLFMVLEYIDGESLAELVEREGAISAARVARILQQTLWGLQEAHAQGMLHRDIKPANIMVYSHMGVQDQVKLLDFGIVKKLDSEATGTQDLTDDSTLIGTPRYMSPEYIRGDEVGPNSDLYSLGLVAYELATGTRAIQADSSIQIISQHLQPTSFLLPPDAMLPEGLRQIINAMMRKDPAERYQSAEDVLHDLSAVLPTLSEQQGRGASLVLSAPAPAPAEAGSGRRAAMLGVAGLLAIVALGMGGMLMAQRAQRDVTAASTTTTASPSAEDAARAATATLAPQPLSIITTPPGATLSINGQDFGTTPRRAIDPRAVAFPARVTVSLQGVSKTIEVKAPATLELELGVAPEPPRPTPADEPAGDPIPMASSGADASKTATTARKRAADQQEQDTARRAIKRKTPGPSTSARVEAARAKLRKQRDLPDPKPSTPADKPPATPPTKPATTPKTTTTGYVDVF